MIRPPDSSSLTPMMQQYFSAKEKCPDAVLFFRMGDFYEMFFDDAEIASEILGITLTSRSKDSANPIPMAGIPVRAIDSYIPKLLRAGRRIAICEQLQDPREAKGIVDRDIVRVISPGTVIDEKLVGEKSNNYLATIVAVKSQRRCGFGIAWLDVTTGRFVLWQTPEAAPLAALLGRIGPAECLLPESYLADSESGFPRELVADLFLTSFPDHAFDEKNAHRTLTEHFGVRTLEGFGCEHLDLGVRAAGGLLRYVQDTQKVALKHLTRIEAFRDERVVPIDRSTRRALELTESSRDGDRRGSLLGSFDRTATAPGGRKLRQWLLEPLTRVEEILERQQVVQALVDEPDRRQSVFELLRQVYDLERIGGRISFGSANARDLAALGRTLGALPRLRELLQDLEPRLLGTILARCSDLGELRDRIERAIADEPPIALRDGGLLRPGYDEELDELRTIATEGKLWFARYQEREVARTGIPSLKVGYNKVFGYFVEVTNTHLDKVPEDFVRKQTLKNCERFVTPDLKEYENKVLHARDRALDLEYELFCAVREEAARHIAALQQTADALAELDVLLTFAGLAHQRGYVRPTIDDSTRLFIEDGRHPVVEQVATTEPFIANSISLEDDANVMVITGPNMAGKSTYIRQVALLTLLAQTGSFIPARRAEIGVVDRVFTRVGASDDLTRGQSTFMVEMSETANIINNATRRSLIVLDEVGRGTSTFDGLSLAWAITEHIAEHIRARTLFATHYHELTEITRSFSCARNFNFAVKEWNDEIIFLRKVVEGAADKSYGIHVARLAGIPRAVLDRAREILSNLESQALDLRDQPTLARSHRPAAPAAPAPETTAAPRALQLDLFRDANEGILKELKKLDTDSLTPLDALKKLADLRRRIV